jgi:hypothetical protein
MDINLNRNSESNDSSGIFIFVIIVIAILFIYFWMGNSPKKNYSKQRENFIDMNTRNMMQLSNIPNTYSEYQMNNIKQTSNDNIYSEDKIDVEEINIIDDYKESDLSNQNNMISPNMNVSNMNSSNMNVSSNMNSSNMNVSNMNSSNMNVSNMNSSNMNVSNMNSSNMNVSNNPVNNLTNNDNVDISGFLNGDQSCNMSKMQKELVSDYKKKYFNMYKHQIECPKECGLNNKGYNPMQGSCQLSNMKRCNLSENNDCEGIVTSDYNNPDVFSLGFLALDNNNNKSCVTCTSNDNRQTKNMKSPSQVNNEDNDVEVNRRRLDNRNKFADFNNYIEQNGVMETSVDKLAEIRTCTNGTCGLESFGRKVSDVYDNLLSTTYTTNKKNCNSGMISGVLEDASMTSYMQPLN